MSITTNRLPLITVAKLGGSVLTNSAAYRLAAEFLAKRIHGCPEERLVVVVSAQQGLTDSLERVAQEIHDSPNARTRDLLWYTGELRSVALLTLSLEALGIGAIGLNAHQSGVEAWPENDARRGFHVVEGRLADALNRYRVVIVPGFFAVRPNQSLVSLGRGGSDLTAVLLAHSLGANCELIKDVPGFHTSDPRTCRKARPIPVLSYRHALAKIYAGCELVQREALEAVVKFRVPLVIRSLRDEAPFTVVSDDADVREACHVKEMESGIARSQGRSDQMEA